jgi:hypothetical protein
MEEEEEEDYSDVEYRQEPMKFLGQRQLQVYPVIM